MSEQQPQPLFTIERVYMKDMSLEMPHAPQIFLGKESPVVDVRLHNEARPLDNGVFEVVLTATITAKLQEKTAFLVEVAQAGIFQIRNFDQAQLDGAVNVTCPRILLPYAREAVTAVMTRAGLPPVLLPHVGFESLYEQRQQAQAAGASAPPPADGVSAPPAGK
jgi:preprotein translocase subunit SecB